MEHTRSIIFLIYKHNRVTVRVLYYAFRSKDRSTRYQLVYTFKFYKETGNFLTRWSVDRSDAKPCIHAWGWKRTSRVRQQHAYNRFFKWVFLGFPQDFEIRRKSLILNCLYFRILSILKKVNGKSKIIISITFMLKLTNAPDFTHIWFPCHEESKTKCLTNTVRTGMSKYTVL